MSNKVYVLQVSDGEDPKLLSKIITTGCWRDVLQRDSFRDSFDM